MKGMLIFSGAAASLAAALALSCSSVTAQKTGPGPFGPDVQRQRLAWIADRISNMSYEEKRGYLCMVNIPDTRLSEYTVKMLRTNHIMGVILFRYNIQSELQLRQLTRDLRARVDPDLLIAVDQEGGMVTRVPWDSCGRISEQMMGKKDQLVYTYSVFYRRARYLLSLGINMVLAPVADIPVSSCSFMFPRCFGTNAETVARLVDISVKAQKDAGLISVLKHFPGHGKTVVDSHRNFPVINMGPDAMRREMLPFLYGITAGAEVIMIGHIINTNIDSDMPASVSRKYFDLLRSFGFNGVVITDDLAMAGKLTNGIGWGINIMTGSTSEIQRMIQWVRPEDGCLDKVMYLVHFHQGAK